MVDVAQRRHRHLSKLRQLLRENFPDATDDALQPILDRALGLKRAVFDAWCVTSTHDTTMYTVEDLMQGQRGIGVSAKQLTGYCVHHAVFHHYNPEDLHACAKVLRLTALNEIRALGFNPLSRMLVDYVSNEYYSQPTQLVQRHVEAIGWAREVFAAQKRDELAYIFEELTPEQRAHFYMCGRKTAYATEAAAVSVLDTLPAESGMSPVLAYAGQELPLRVYECDTCAKYHLGHGSGYRDFARVPQREMDRLASIWWTQAIKGAERYARRLGYTLPQGVTQAAITDRFPKAATYDRHAALVYQAG